MSKHRAGKHRTTEIATITIRLEIPYYEDEALRSEARLALANLAWVCFIQTEDDLYDNGLSRKDGGEFVSEILDRSLDYTIGDAE